MPSPSETVLPADDQAAQAVEGRLLEVAGRFEDALRERVTRLLLTSAEATPRENPLAEAVAGRAAASASSASRQRARGMKCSLLADYAPCHGCHSRFSSLVGALKAELPAVVFVAWSRRREISPMTFESIHSDVEIEKFLGDEERRPG